MTSPVTVAVLIAPLLTAHPRSPKAPRKRSQHCWMLHVASLCTTYCVFLGVVTQSLKPGKLLSQQLSTFLLFCDRWSEESNNVGSVWTALPTLLGPGTLITHDFPGDSNVITSCDRPTLLGVVASVCTPLPTPTHNSQHRWPSSRSVIKF